MRQLIARSLSTIAVAVSLLIVVPGDALAQIDAQRGLRPVMRRPIPAAALRGSVDFLRDGTILRHRKTGRRRHRRRILSRPPSSAFPEWHDAKAGWCVAQR